MNNHLLLFPYNQPISTTWLARVTLPLRQVIFSGPKQHAPSQPQATPNSIEGDGDRLSLIRVICILVYKDAAPPAPDLHLVSDVNLSGTAGQIRPRGNFR